MFDEKQKVLADAPGALNKPDRPWEVTVEGNCIVARWKWMDATFFGLSEVSNEVKEYTYTAELKDNGKYGELDSVEQQSEGAGRRRGRSGFGASSSTFTGKTNQKSIQFGYGKDNKTGETGLIGFKFSTSEVKNPIREYLKSRGWEADLSFAKANRPGIMDRGIFRLVFRIVYFVFFLISAFFISGFIESVDFVRNDLHRWRDTTATILDSKVIDARLEHVRSRGTSTSSRTRTQYEVKYTYSGEFTAWDRVFAFEETSSNRGRASGRIEQIPDSAYVIPKQGDVIGVIYDPDAEGSYRIGSSEEFRKNAEISITNPLLFIPGIFIAAGLLLLIIDIRGIIKRRAALN